mmetsp:Transcript_24845/g.51639  ORF Transcript_24845/g.51639 Transcript_24845/m.51639 type:complete len:107 (+) Transcript_24845:488-808(+)
MAVLRQSANVLTGATSWTLFGVMLKWHNFTFGSMTLGCTSVIHVLNNEEHVIDCVCWTKECKTTPRQMGGQITAANDVLDRIFNTPNQRFISFLEIVSSTRTNRSV